MLQQELFGGAEQKAEFAVLAWIWTGIPIKLDEAPDIDDINTDKE